MRSYHARSPQSCPAVLGHDHIASCRHMQDQSGRYPPRIIGSCPPRPAPCTYRAAVSICKMKGESRLAGPENCLVAPQFNPLFLIRKGRIVAVKSRYAYVREHFRGGRGARFRRRNAAPASTPLLYTAKTTQLEKYPATNVKKLTS